MENKTEEGARIRTISGSVSILQKVIFIAIPVAGAFFVMDGPFYLGWSVQQAQYYGLFLGLVLAGVFLTVPFNSKAPSDRVPWYDLVLAALGLIVGMYIAVFYVDILFKLGQPDPGRLIMGGMAIVIVLEAARRTAGWILPAICVFFILYARFADLAPGDFASSATDWPKLVNYLYADTNSLLGLPISVAAGVVLGFIFFGAVLFSIGAGDFLQNFALALLGRFRGGPAKMAVVASGLFGMISGSAVANVATVGVFTIPLMKRNGYRPFVAGAIEAVGSTGGQLMPPVMGAAAFLMADFLRVPYAEVALSAALPAILYYIVLFTQVDLEAGKFKLRGLPKNQLPSLSKAIRLSWLFLIPLAGLMIGLFALNWEAAKAGFAATFLGMAVGLARSNIRAQLVKWLLDVLQGTGKSLLEMGVISAIAGLIIGSIQVSGLAYNLSSALVNLAHGNVFALLVLTAIVGIVLGMGMPTTAVYVLLAVLVAPALVQMGIPAMAAHLFIFYYGMLSMISPPVCMAAFAAAAIARANFWTTGYQAMRLGVVAYILPFLFVFSPALLGRAPLEAVVLAMVTAVVGSVLLAMTATGYFVRDLSWGKRVVLALCAVCLLVPTGIGGGISLGPFELGGATDVIGLVVAAPLLYHEWQASRSPAVAAA